MGIVSGVCIIFEINAGSWIWQGVERIFSAFGSCWHRSQIQRSASIKGRAKIFVRAVRIPALRRIPDGSRIWKRPKIIAESAAGGVHGGLGHLFGPGFIGKSAGRGALFAHAGEKTYANQS